MDGMPIIEAAHPDIAHAATLGRRIRLLSYNIQVGIGGPASFRHYLTGSWKHVLPHARLEENLTGIGRAVAGFDIVALQEVDAGSLRSGFVNQTEYLATVGDFPFWYHQTNRRFGHFAQHANGVLSKFRPTEVVEYKLPGIIPGRGAMMVRYGGSDHPLVVLIMHLALSSRARHRQLDFIGEVVNRYEHVVLMGDLNCQADSPEMQSLLNATHLCEPLHGLKTFPSWRPARKIDHILTSPSIHVEDVHVLQHMLSDHLPIAMDIVLPEHVNLAA
jgi:endonuclease/exonuclease/phosphatase family metal-dependent hydrolase